MRFQKSGEAASIFGLPLHAEGHGLQAPQRQPAVERAQVRAFCILQCRSGLKSDVGMHLAHAAGSVPVCSALVDMHLLVLGQ